MTQITPEQCRARRQVRGLSQIGLSKLSGLADNYVCRFENRKIAEPSGRKLSEIEAAIERTPVPEEFLIAIRASKGGRTEAESEPSDVPDFPSPKSDERKAP